MSIYISLKHLTEQIARLPGVRKAVIKQVETAGAGAETVTVEITVNRLQHVEPPPPALGVNASDGASLGDSV